MEDTNIEAICADPGKPKKQLPKNFWKFFFVAAVILSFVAGYLIGGASNLEKIEDQKRGERYHRATCSSLSHSSYEVTLSEAMDAGYTPCKNCHPPTK